MNKRASLDLATKEESYLEAITLYNEAHSRQLDLGDIRNIYTRMKLYNGMDHYDTVFGKSELIDNTDFVQNLIDKKSVLFLKSIIETSRDLKDKQKRVLLLLFFSNEKYGYKDLEKLLDLSTSAIRKIEENAIRRLKNGPADLKLLEDHFDKKRKTMLHGKSFEA